MKPEAPPNSPLATTTADWTTRICQWARELGFQGCGISDIDLSKAETELLQWLADGHHADMDYMHKHGSKRTRPQELVEGTLSIISVRMEYYPPHSRDAQEVLDQPEAAYISRYALGRDYHKVMRQRLQKLANRIQEEMGDFSYRAFVDSAPVMETSIAEKAGLGWKGKHSLVINKNSGSWHFLGELYTNLQLAETGTPSDHCGSCTACIDACPTQAIVKPYTVDARRCISYLTIENPGSIPVEFRAAMGNRIYGCDDCQLVCPWNRFSKESQLDDFQIRHSLDDITLAELASWSEEDFLQRMQGSPIRRIGHENWLRNIAVALGNSTTGAATKAAIASLQQHPSSKVREHADWAMKQLRENQA